MRISLKLIYYIVTNKNKNSLIKLFEFPSKLDIPMKKKSGKFKQFFYIKIETMEKIHLLIKMYIVFVFLGEYSGWGLIGKNNRVNK